MKELTITLETVTSMFLGGAEPRDKPELRPSAFRGLMRYWFRATVGGVIGDQHPEDLRKLETAVFGSTEIGSPISLRLSGTPPYSSHSILPHKPDSGKRLAFDGAQPFSLVMRAKPTIDELVWVNACMSLNLALLFGGIGLRSRRGYGSLRIKNSSSPDLVPPTPESFPHWKRYIELVTKSAIGRAQQLAEKLGVVCSGLPAKVTAFPCASRQSIVRIPENIVEESADGALHKMMKVMPQKGFLGGIQPVRQASPLWMRVFMADHKYHLLLCVLPSELKTGTDYAQLKNFLDTQFPGDDIPIKGWNQ